MADLIVVKILWAGKWRISLFYNVELEASILLWQFCNTMANPPLYVVADLQLFNITTYKNQYNLFLNLLGHIILLDN